MTALARALVWLRWRLAWNGAVHAVRRDALERLLRLAQGLVPILAVMAVVPMAAAMAGLGAVLGFRLGGGERWLFGLVAARLALLVATFACALSAMGMAASVDSGGGTRLALLPIPRRLLFGAQVVAALSDVWVLVVLPLPLLVPAGLLARGRIGGALVAFVAVLLLAALLGLLATAASAATQLVLRHRRVGEWAAIGGMLLLVAVSVVPMIAIDKETDRARPWAAGAFRSVAPWVLPSESWVGVMEGVRSGSAREVVSGLWRLAGAGLLVGVGGWVAFRRVLEQPEAGSGRRARARMDDRRRPMPFLGPGAAAVAEATLRTALRTVRGRFALASAPLMGFVMTFVFAQLPLPLRYKALLGPALAGLVLVLTLLSLHSLQLNQFAVDGPGLTLQALAPLSPRDVVVGKAVAWTALSLVVSLAAVATAALSVPPGPAAAWLAVGLGALAVIALQAPAAAAIAAVMARPADPNTLGPAGNAHPLAILMAMPVVSAGAGPVGLAATIGLLAGRPWTGTALAAAWAALCVVVGLALMGPATRLFARRREAALLAAEGR